MITKKNLTEFQKKEARKNTFVMIGLTGNGKSQIIKFLTGDLNVIVSSNKCSSCTSHPSLFYGEIQSDQYPNKYFCLIDTAGFSDTQGKERDKKNYNDIDDILIRNQCELKGIFIVENFQDERLNGEERKIFEGALDLFPLRKFWNYITIVYTHYYNKGSTNKRKIKKEQENQIIKSLQEINEVLLKRIDNMESVNPYNIHKLYVNIDNNILEKKGYDLNDEEDREDYELGYKDLERAKSDLYKEINEKIHSDPLYDKIESRGTHRILIKKSRDFMSYDIYEAYVEFRDFYLNNKIICYDAVQCSKPSLIESNVNKIGFNLKKFGKRLFIGGNVILSPLVVGEAKIIDLFVEDYNKTNITFEKYFDRLNDLKNEWFPNERDDEYKRTKVY